MYKYEIKLLEGFLKIRILFKEFVCIFFLAYECCYGMILMRKRISDIQKVPKYFLDMMSG